MYVIAHFFEAKRSFAGKRCLHIGILLNLRIKQFSI